MTQRCKRKPPDFSVFVFGWQDEHETGYWDTIAPTHLTPDAVEILFLLEWGRDHEDDPEQHWFVHQYPCPADR